MWPFLLMKRVNRRGAGKANVAVCFTVLGMDENLGDAVCPSGQDTFVSAPIPEIVV
jgi:hypothetical protein